MRAVLSIFAALLLVGCEGRYRYPCQDPVNKDNEECNRPVCEANGYCYDSLNGLPQPQPEMPEVPATDCNCEQKGE